MLKRRSFSSPKMFQRSLGMSWSPFLVSERSWHWGITLGVPALGRAPRRSDFCYLIERVKKKLAGWKATQLSLTGRITLAKSVLEAMPIYPMMTVQLPSACIEEVHRLQRAFIWGDTSTRRKVHKVSWSTMNLPK